jgi:hypothetical protein
VFRFISVEMQHTVRNARLVEEVHGGWSERWKGRKGLRGLKSLKGGKVER